MKIVLSVSGKEKAKGGESAYYKALLSAGAQPDEIEVVAGVDATKMRDESFDGILFTSGEDVDPAFYGEPIKFESVHADRSRDEFEFDLLEKGLKRRLPILGICRGIQMINVKFGGTLYQDLKGEKELDHKQAGSRRTTTHSVTVTEPDSLLRRLIPASCRVNSLHHQAIKRLGHGLKATAHSDDGLYEAVELAEDYPFFLVVQWHPEELVGEHPEQLKIFQEFIAGCRERKARESSPS